MKKVTIAATQMCVSWDLPKNLNQAEKLVREAASQGAQIILLQELFETPYFCIEIHENHFQLATHVSENKAIKHFQSIAKELEVVIPISFFERSGVAHFNSLVVIDADGEVLGKYRKTHIPDAVGYQEKYYFTPGDTGFKVFDTKFAKIGVGICWDQWFPEAARSMTLQGAEILFYPTAIGSEPHQPNCDSMQHWRRVMQGHAAANQIPVVASNRIGTEQGKYSTDEITFYGSSFIANQTGELVKEMDRSTSGVISYQFDIEEIAEFRNGWGNMRDRVPTAYQHLLTLDGEL